MPKTFILILLMGLTALACSSRRSPVTASATLVRPLGAPMAIAAPLGLPPLVVPEGNPPTADAVALGRRLFFDAKLSSDNTLSCASCHSPTSYFADGRKTGQGVGGKLGARNTPSALNAAYGVTQFWDGRAASLEAQAGGPIANPIEMNLPHDVAVARLNADQSYRDEFARVFGAGDVTMGKVEQAIASFERTLLSANSPFDRYQFGGDKKALSESAVRGLAVFTDKNKGNCAVCHTIGEKSALFTDDKFHNLGVGVNAEGELKDLGRYEQTHNDADRGAFRTPSLRNVARTAPYMHDGSLKTLREVVDFYIGGGNFNPHRDKEMKPLPLKPQERDDLIAFLESLTGEMPADSGPPPAK